MVTKGSLKVFAENFICLNQAVKENVNALFREKISFPCDNYIKNRKYASFCIK